ncbi:MAG: sortase [Patescibacteria group bacterium]|nr:sortase [Patescibacteria group bacterium]
MRQSTRYVLFGGIFLIAVGILAYPYLHARLDSVKPIVDDADVDPEVSEAEEIGVPNRLLIADLGIEAPIQYVEEKSESVYQEALRRGVVHFPGTALPGEPGNVYIFGHSSDYIWSPGEYKTVFAKLPQIEIGTEIQITNANGDIFRYTVLETKVVGPRDVSVLDQQNNQKYLLTLQTSYPLGTALQRYIVVAERIQD